MDRKNNLTQVRVRQKDAGYVYGQGQISEVQMTTNQQSAGQTSMLWEKKRLTQEKIEQYRELKLQKQIAQIES